MSYFRTICRATVGAVLFYSTLAMPALCDEGSLKDSDWKISVAASQDADKQWQLDVVMEYHGEKPTELSNDAIPWKWPDAMIVCAVSELSRPYPPKTVDSDRPKGHVMVKPGETLKGTIPLRSLFDLRESGWFRRSTIIVFWSYKSQQSDRVGGWIEIPEEKSSWQGWSKTLGLSAPEGLKFQVSVEAVNDEKGADTKEKAGSNGWKSLNIAIEHNNEHYVSIWSFELPWRWHKAITICAVPVNGQRPEPLDIWTDITINDPPISSLKIKPGEVLHGEFAPQSLFQRKGLREAFQKGPVIVFWAYRVTFSNWVGGWFEVDETQDSLKEKRGN